MGRHLQQPTKGPATGHTARLTEAAGPSMETGVTGRGRSRPRHIHSDAHSHFPELSFNRGEMTPPFLAWTVGWMIGLRFDRNVTSYRESNFSAWTDLRLQAEQKSLNLTSAHILLVRARHWPAQIQCG